MDTTYDHIVCKPISPYLYVYNNRPTTACQDGCQDLFSPPSQLHSPPPFDTKVSCLFCFTLSVFPVSSVSSVFCDHNPGRLIPPSSAALRYYPPPLTYRDTGLWPPVPAGKSSKPVQVYTQQHTQQQAVAGCRKRGSGEWPTHQPSDASVSKYTMATKRMYTNDLT